MNGPLSESIQAKIVTIIATFLAILSTATVLTARNERLGVADWQRQGARSGLFLFRWHQYPDAHRQHARADPSAASAGLPNAPSKKPQKRAT